MTYQEKANLICNILTANTDISVFSTISITDYVDALISGRNIAKYLGISSSKLSNLHKSLFSNEPKNVKTINYILSLGGFKHCTRCKGYLKRDDFRSNSHNFDGLNNYCKECHSITTSRTQTARQSAYRASKILRTPGWADLNKIKEIYNNCPKGFEVDHIFPLNGKNSCGLHVENNLQYLSPGDNQRKSNKEPKL